MKRIYLVLTILILFTPLFSQEKRDTSIAIDDAIQEVIICSHKKSKSFHSYDECIGLETCNDSLQRVTYDQAIDVHTRKECCYCWEGDTRKCANDNPSAEEVIYEDEEVNTTVEDFFWLTEDLYFGYAIFAIGAVAILSNEIYIGFSYPVLPPILEDVQRADITAARGIDILFRKNFKRDALEYGFNYHVFEYQENIIVNDVSKFMFVLSYLKEFNRHFSRKNNSRLKIYAGPLLTFENNIFRRDRANPQSGIGLSFVTSLALSKRVNLDFRSIFSSHSSELKIGLRWQYQRKYAWR